jgi:UDP-N-acetylglucosamine--N-acetylmuramyl-(pentapeptide) pyrophosphoryl-undecaprenol N-acetylglucosamine transferase
MFVGTKRRIEARVVPEHGYPFVAIWISGLRRSFAAENLLFPLKVVVSLVQSFIVLWRVKPDVVVGTGGYVCGPVVFAALVAGIPTVLQEQNSYPGMTTRLLASRVDEVHLSFKTSARHLRRIDNVRLTGNPTRSVIGTVRKSEGAEYFGMDPGKKTLLVFGGSRGASSLNRAMIEALPDLVGENLQVIWQTGEKEYDEVLRAVESRTSSGRAEVKVFKFIDRMEYAYSIADLAVCRAGATTVAELTRAGVPSVLVPFPYAAADHQTENARAMAEAGASILIPDHELRSRLSLVVLDLLGDVGRLEQMTARARELGKPEAAAELARAILRLTEGNNGRTGQNLQV